VQLSDFHSGARVRLENALPEIVGGVGPDLIVFTGDAVNENAGSSRSACSHEQFMRLSDLESCASMCHGVPRTRRIAAAAAIAAAAVNASESRRFRPAAAWTGVMAPRLHS
jgi:hypothetical protein